MGYKGKEFNKLGKPISRTNNGRFAKGNQEGKIFGKDQKPKGRISGSRNLMTILKDVALSKNNQTKSNIEIVFYEMFMNMKRMQKVLKNLEDNGKENTPEYRRWLDRYQENCVKLSEHAVKYSGDYTAKFQAEIGEHLSDDEKEMMQKYLKNDAKI